MGWVFQGNPNKFDINDYLGRYPELLYWRTPRYATEITIGDRAFIWRAGSESGAVAIGTVVETPTIALKVKHPEALGDDLWSSSRPDPSEPKTGIHLEDVRLTLTENMLIRDLVKANVILAQTTLIRMPNGTIFKLSIDETEALERLWGITSSISITGSHSSTEGAMRLRSHYIRERSSRLRVDKINDFKTKHCNLVCEICGEKESLRYSSIVGEKIFEVHHRAPLAKAITPVRTTLDDLAILCANCHRAVHASDEVDANFNTLCDHFGK